MAQEPDQLQLFCSLWETPTSDQPIYVSFSSEGSLNPSWEFDFSAPDVCTPDDDNLALLTGVQLRIHLRSRVQLRRNLDLDMVKCSMARCKSLQFQSNMTKEQPKDTPSSPTATLPSHPKATSTSSLLVPNSSSPSSSSSSSSSSLSINSTTFCGDYSCEAHRLGSLVIVSQWVDLRYLEIAHEPIRFTEPRFLPISSLTHSPSSSLYSKSSSPTPEGTSLRRCPSSPNSSASSPFHLSSPTPTSSYAPYHISILARLLFHMRGAIFRMTYEGLTLPPNQYSPPSPSPTPSPSLPSSSTSLSNPTMKSSSPISYSMTETLGSCTAASSPPSLGSSATTTTLGMPSSPITLTPAELRQQSQALVPATPKGVQPKGPTAGTTPHGIGNSSSGTMAGGMRLPMGVTARNQLTLTQVINQMAELCMARLAVRTTALQVTVATTDIDKAVGYRAKRLKEAGTYVGLLKQMEVEANQQSQSYENEGNTSEARRRHRMNAYYIPLAKQQCSPDCHWVTAISKDGPPCLCLRRARLARLRELVNRESHDLSYITALVNSRRQILRAKAMELVAVGRILARGTQQLVLTRNICNEQARQALHPKRMALTYRRLRMLSEMVKILPITSGPEDDRRLLLKEAAQGKTGLTGKALSAAKAANNAASAAAAAQEAQGIYVKRAWYVRGLHLPYMHVAMIAMSNESDEIATALGYVVVLVKMLSEHLEVPLRYPLHYRGSRSMVSDELAYGQVYPLFINKSSDEKRFERALDYLNRNIRLLLMCGLTNPRSVDIEPNNTLQNLHTLLMNEIPVD